MVLQEQPDLYGALTETELNITVKLMYVNLMHCQQADINMWTEAGSNCVHLFKYWTVLGACILLEYFYFIAPMVLLNHYLTAIVKSYF